METPLNNAQEFFRGIVQRQDGAVEFCKANTNTILQKVTLTLTLAGEYTYNLSGNYVYAIEATDGEAEVSLQFSRKDSLSNSFPITKGLGYQHPFDKIHFSWSAQTGKTITILVASFAPEIFGVIDNRSQNDILTTLENIEEQLTGTNNADFDVVAVLATATLIVPANADRKSVIVSHRGDGVGLIYLGFDNTVTALKHFIQLAPGESWSIDDYTGDVYAIRSAGATNAIWGETE